VCRFIACLALLQFASVTARLYNFQQPFPHNLYLSDFTGDGVDEWLAFGRSTMFIVRADYLSIGQVAYPLAGDPRLVMHGRFQPIRAGAAASNRDDICMLLPNGSLSCVGVGNDLRVTAWLTQPGSDVFSSNLVVADLTGDGVHEIIDCKGGSVFGVEASQKFVKLPIEIAADVKALLSALTAGAESAMQVRVARLEGERSDSLILFNQQDGTATRIALGTANGKSSLQKQGNAIKVPASAAERVSIARVRGLAFDDVVLYTPSSGLYRFCGFTGTFTGFGCLAQGSTDPDLSSARGEQQLFWGHLSARNAGDAMRHDSLLYNPGSKMFYVAVAGSGNAAAVPTPLPLRITSCPFSVAPPLLAASFGLTLSVRSSWRMIQTRMG